MKLSKAQQYKFWSLFKEAVQEALPADASKAEIDAFRYKLIEDATGKTSLTLVSKCKEYDLLMAATAFCTENDQEKLYWCTTSERRFLHLIGTGLTQIGQIAKEPHAWDYVKGILHQAHWPDTWKCYTQYSKCSTPTVAACSGRMVGVDPNMASHLDSPSHAPTFTLLVVSTTVMTSPLNQPHRPHRRPFHDMRINTSCSRCLLWRPYVLV
jgi:hypothetical protein